MTKPLTYSDLQGIDGTDAGIIELMLRAARCAAYVEHDEHIRAALAGIPAAVVTRMLAIEALHDGIREACWDLYQRERSIVRRALKGNLSAPELEPATQDGPHDVAPDPAGSRSPDEGV